MALLLNAFRHHLTMLRPVHMLGREPQACHTLVNAPDVSKLHAEIHWNQGQWEICDRSRNGTWLDDRRILFGQWVPLTPNARIRISTDPIGDWCVTDLAPPCTSLLPDDPAQDPITLQSHDNFLPNALQPQVSVYLQNDQWVVEHLHGTDNLQDGRRIHVDGQGWEFVLCTLLSSTLDLLKAPAASPPVAPSFRFHISQNEEHVTLDLQLGSNSIALGERTHHYALATLARHRVHDAQRGLEDHSQGWMQLETLAGKLGVDPAYVNIQIFRARQQIASALDNSQPTQAHPLPPVVERRRGEVRFGAYACTIRKGSKDEGSLLPGARCETN